MLLDVTYKFLLPFLQLRIKGWRTQGCSKAALAGEVDGREDTQTPHEILRVDPRIARLPAGEKGRWVGI